MGRTRPKSKKTKLVKAEPTTQQSSQPSTSSLIEKTQALITQCDYPLAERFINRVLEREPTNAEARELLVVVLLETGQLDIAKQVRNVTLCRSVPSHSTHSISYIYQTLETLIPPHPDAPSPPPSSAYLYLAQLSEDDPHGALRHYQSAVDLMTSQLKGKERATDAAGVGDDEVEVRRNIVRALIGMVEIWMDPSYDLW